MVVSIENKKTMKTISLTKGKVALVDDEDFEYLNQHKWHYNSRGYAARNVTPQNGKRTVLLMHRSILNTPPGMDTDHIDLNRLNNQKCNLRVCNTSQNMMNRGKRHGVTSSKFKGVSIFRTARHKTGYYLSYIQVNGKMIKKYFPLTPDGERQAALHYNKLAVKHFGKFARLNNIQ